MSSFGMTSGNVVHLYNWLRDNGIIVWIDGGWAVDALAGQQTREHADLDIAVHQDNATLRTLLESNGYRELIRSDSCEFMYVMQNQEPPLQGSCLKMIDYEIQEN